MSNDKGDVGKAPTAENPVNYVVDALHLECPAPVVLTKKALRRMVAGQTVLVQCTDPMAEIDLPVLLMKTEDELVSVEKAETVINFLIRKA